MPSARFPIGISLSSVLLSFVLTSQLLGLAFVDDEPDESEFWVTMGYCILVVYLLFLLRYFVTNEGRKYTVSSFSISVILSFISSAMYLVEADAWGFFNENYVLEDDLLASIQPTIILLVLNEWVGIPLRMRGRTANFRQNHPTSLIRIGLVTSLPLVVMNPNWGLGLIILIPTLIIFFVLYWASTDYQMILNGN